MSEYQIKTTLENRDKLLARIAPFGDVTDEWSDGSFDFECYDNACENTLREILEDLEIEAELL